MYSAVYVYTVMDAGELQGVISHNNVYMYLLIS